jgi:hypothetical protein
VGGGEFVGGTAEGLHVVVIEMDLVQHQFSKQTKDVNGLRL